MGGKQSTDGANRFALSVLAKQVAFDRQQLEELQVVFSKHAVDDQLKFEQFDSALREAGLKAPGSDALLAKLFDTFDTQRSKVLNFREFAVGLSTFLEGTLEQKLKFAFHTMDSAKNGSISLDEFASMLSICHAAAIGKPNSGGQVTEEILQIASHIFNSVDKNQDGRLNFQEYQDVVIQHPMLVDFVGLGVEDEGKNDGEDGGGGGEAPRPRRSSIRLSTDGEPEDAALAAAFASVRVKNKDEEPEDDGVAAAAAAAAAATPKE